MNGLDLFSGIGGITIALGRWVRPVAYCENDRFAQAVLLSRMADGSLPRAPIWDDVSTLHGDMLPPDIDIIYGGFPCQDISCAGLQRGLEGERSGLVREIWRLADEIRPRYIFLENVPAIVTAGFDSVLAALAKRGFDARWMCLSAADVGACHLRNRWWLLAANSDYQGGLQQKGALPEIRGRIDNGRSQNDPDPDNRIGIGVLQTHPAVYPQMQAAPRSNGKAGDAPPDPHGLPGIPDHPRDNMEWSQQNKLSSSDREAAVFNSHSGYLRIDKTPDPSRKGRTGRDSEILREHPREWISRTNGASTGDDRGGRQLAFDFERLPSLPDIRGLDPVGWPTVPPLCGADDGIQFRVDRLRGLGNSVVPQCAGEAFERLMGISRED